MSPADVSPATRITADLGDLPALTAGFSPFQPVIEKTCCGGITGDLCTCVCDATKDHIEIVLAPAVLLEMAPTVRMSQSGGYWSAVA